MSGQALGDIADRILGLLSTHPQMMTYHLANCLRWGKKDSLDTASVLRQLKRMEKAGQVVRIKSEYSRQICWASALKNANTALHITEGIGGSWYYHLSVPGTNATALCGAKTMSTALPLSSWGVQGHLSERYCSHCQTQGDAVLRAAGACLKAKGGTQ